MSFSSSNARIKNNEKSGVRKKCLFSSKNQCVVIDEDRNLVPTSGRYNLRSSSPYKVPVDKERISISTSRRYNLRSSSPSKVLTDKERISVATTRRYNLRSLSPSKVLVDKDKISVSTFRQSSECPAKMNRKEAFFDRLIAKETNSPIGDKKSAAKSCKTEKKVQPKSQIPKYIPPSPDKKRLLKKHQELKPHSANTMSPYKGILKKLSTSSSGLNRLNINDENNIKEGMYGPILTSKKVQFKTISCNNLNVVQKDNIDFKTPKNNMQKCTEIKFSSIEGTGRCEKNTLKSTPSYKSGGLSQGKAIYNTNERNCHSETNEIPIKEEIRTIHVQSPRVLKSSDYHKKDKTTPSSYSESPISKLRSQNFVQQPQADVINLKQSENIETKQQISSEKSLNTEKIFTRTENCRNFSDVKAPDIRNIHIQYQSEDITSLSDGSPTFKMYSQKCSKQTEADSVSDKQTKHIATKGLDSSKNYLNNNTGKTFTQVENFRIFSDLNDSDILFRNKSLRQRDHQEKSKDSESDQDNKFHSSDQHNLNDQDNAFHCTVGISQNTEEKISTENKTTHHKDINNIPGGLFPHPVLSPLPEDEVNEECMSRRMSLRENVDERVKILTAEFLHEMNKGRTYTRKRSYKTPNANKKKVGKCEINDVTTNIKTFDNINEIFTNIDNNESFPKTPTGIQTLENDSSCHQNPFSPKNDFILNKFGTPKISKIPGNTRKKDADSSLSPKHTMAPEIQEKIITDITAENEKQSNCKITSGNDLTKTKVLNKNKTDEKEIKDKMRDVEKIDNEDENFLKIDEECNHAISSLKSPNQIHSPTMVSCRAQNPLSPRSDTLGTPRISKIPRKKQKTDVDLYHSPKNATKPEMLEKEITDVTADSEKQSVIEITAGIDIYNTKVLNKTFDDKENDSPSKRNRNLTSLSEEKCVSNDNSRKPFSQSYDQENKEMTIKCGVQENVSEDQVYSLTNNEFHTNDDINIFLSRDDDICNEGKECKSFIDEGKENNEGLFKRVNTSEKNPEKLKSSEDYLEETNVGRNEQTEKNKITVQKKKKRHRDKHLSKCRGIKIFILTIIVMCIFFFVMLKYVLDIQINLM